MAKEIQKRDSNRVVVLKKYLDNESVKKRFEEMLGKNAGAFMNSLINIYYNNPQLQKCTPESYTGAGLRAASFNMPVDPALGWAAIVPYGNIATFQFMYKGITQLCIRSNQYATIHCSEVYADELKSYNPITGIVTFHDPKIYKMRHKDKGKNVVGHYAYFKLLTGFEKSDYMTTEEAMAHARKYSKAYQYDLKQKKKTSTWSTDPIPMCNKTILLRLLTKYGVMSIEMQEAFIAERENFEDAQAMTEEVIKNEAGSETIPATFEEEPDPETKTKVAKAKADLKDAEAKAKAKAEEAEPTFL